MRYYRPIPRKKVSGDGEERMESPFIYIRLAATDYSLHTDPKRVPLSSSTGMALLASRDNAKIQGAKLHPQATTAPGGLEFTAQHHYQ